VTLLGIYSYAFKLYLTIAVFIASCERSFSKLKLTKSYLSWRIASLFYLFFRLKMILSGNWILMA